MGYIRHGTAVATTSNDRALVELDSWYYHLSREERRYVVRSEVVVNGYQSYAVLPDGSKENWPASDRGDTLRKQLMDICSIHNVDALWVDFGGDDRHEGPWPRGYTPPRDDPEEEV